MAKQTTNRSGPSRIRFIMVEADLQEGDLEKVTQVLQNAFRTTQVLPTRTPVARIGSKSQTNPNEFEEEPLSAEEGEFEQIPEEVVPERPKAPRRPRPAKVPTVLSDIDAKSDPSLKDFVSDYDLKSSVDRYLVVALWFRDARHINSVTVDHVYTCFRLLSWPTASTDFSKPLKNLRDEQSMTGGTKGFTLTLTGAGKIEAKKRSSQ